MEAMMTSLFCLLIVSSFVHALSSPPLPQKVAVIGATGRLGREAVQQLSARGIPCKVLLRQLPVAPGATVGELATAAAATTPTTAKDPTAKKEEVVSSLLSLPNVEAVRGDVSNAEALAELLKDCTACLAVFGAARRSKISDVWNSNNVQDEDPTHAKNVNYLGVANVIEAARASDSCKRIVRITGKGESPNSFFSVLINLLGSMAKAWNYEGEQLLRGQNDVDYTIIRPGIMSEEGPTGRVLALADDGADLPVAKIRYADVASLCIDCLAYPNAARSTLTAMTTEEGKGEASYETLLGNVRPDRREFPTNMMEQHRAAVTKAVVGMGFASMLFVGMIARIILGVLF